MSFNTMNPADISTDQGILAEYQYHSLSEAFEKIRRFSSEQMKWKNLPLKTRAQIIKKLAQQVRSQKENFARQAALEMGKPITQGIAEVEKCAVALETIAAMAVQDLKEKTVSAHYPKTLVTSEPYGLIFSIQPWNFPYWQALRMAACAWMAGNLVVLKHSDEVAGCAELIEKYTEVDGNKLLLNLRLTHADAAEIIKSPLIQAVTFTGSTSGGKTVAQTAGGALKKCILELGGSDAYIVLPDCDLELAVRTCVEARLINSGQSCIAGKRFFVHHEIYPAFKKKFKELLQATKVGDPLRPDTQVGPLSASRFLQQLQDQAKRARSAGAKLEWTELELPPNGYYTQLGILDFGSSLKVFENEEIFGPVASLYHFTDLEEVIKVINEGPFGLGGGIFTKDLSLAEKVSHQVRVGTFVVNSFVKSDPRVPFGGFRESGVGREMGLEGLHDFVAWKVIGFA